MCGQLEVYLYKYVTITGIKMLNLNHYFLNSESDGTPALACHVIACLTNADVSQSRKSYAI